jgi:hypothetical protein
MVRRRHVGPMIGLAAVLCLAAPALADQLYAVDGRDSFSVGARDVRGDIVYSGRETLSSTRASDGTRYVASVDYVRAGQGIRARAHASFISIVKPSGEQSDEFNGDPDYVAILNQPFSIELDLPTMREVAGITTPAPFTFVLPITGAPATGSIRSAGAGYVAGERALGVVFEADGTVHGLPGNLGVSLDGRIHMRGTAYYAYGSAILRSLDTQLTISGTLAGDASHKAVTIVYHRTIRALPPASGSLKDAAR